MSVKSYDSTGSTPRNESLYQHVDSDSPQSSEVATERPMPGPILHNGISALTAAIFIVGEMAGSGVLALPRAVVDSGWIGPILVIVLCINACYGGTRLGICWEILEERYPEHRGTSRNPYPTIAQRAMGRWGSLLVSASVQITLFGAGVVYLLLASHIVQELVEPFVPKVSFCTWFIVFAIVITPPMWLGTPKDFCLVGAGAVISTALSCIFMFVQIVTDGINLKEPPQHVPKSSMDFFLSFGIILFAFGGASTFPTIQNDMVDRSKFKKSVYGAFAVILVLFLPIALGSYLVYGDSTNANILLSLTKGPNVICANIFMAIHLILAFFIVINPVCQEVENSFNVPHEFCLWRCVVRTCMVFLMIIVGESIPQFAKIIALIGGSTITLLTFVLPNYFYIRLCDQESTLWPKRRIPMHMRVYMWELIIMGIGGGVAATYSALLAIIRPDSDSTSCFGF